MRPILALRLCGLLLLGAGCNSSAPEKTTTPPPPKPSASAPATIKIDAPVVKGKPVEYETNETKEVHIVEGPAEWEEETRVRLSGAVWTFKPDGGFIFAPGMSREDLFPINGKYRREGSHYVFEGTRTVETQRMETGHSEVTGTLDFSATVLTIQMKVSTRIGDGKVREDDPSSVANNGVYEATVQVKKATAQP